jgi:hypothetical protein
MNEGVSPSDAVDLSADTAEGAADAAAEHAAAEGASGSVDAEDMGGSGTSITDALMHTEPRMRPESLKSDLGVGDAGAHAMIAVRKFVAGLGFGGDGGGDGTPAIVHAGIAAYHSLVVSEADEEASDDDGGDAEIVAVKGGDASKEYRDPAEEVAA